MILQQGELDLQSGGVDISVCLHPWDAGRATPELPIMISGPAYD
jgi:hypothetical protein